MVAGDAERGRRRRRRDTRRRRRADRGRRSRRARQWRGGRRCILARAAKKDTTYELVVVACVLCVCVCVCVCCDECFLLCLYGFYLSFDVHVRCLVIAFAVCARPLSLSLCLSILSISLSFISPPPPPPPPPISLLSPSLSPSPPSAYRTGPGVPTAYARSGSWGRARFGVSAVAAAAPLYAHVAAPSGQVNPGAQNQIGDRAEREKEIERDRKERKRDLEKEREREMVLRH